MGRLLIDDWRNWWKIYTIQFWIIVGYVPELMATLSSDVKDYLPESLRGMLAIVATISIMLRLKKQNNITNKELDTKKDK